MAYPRDQAGSYNRNDVLFAEFAARQRVIFNRKRL